MTVLTVKPKYAGLSGSGHLEGVREYSKVFVAVTDSVSDGIRTVGNDSRLPQKGDSYFWQGESDPGALCWNVDPQQDPNNQLVWIVTCHFSSDMKQGVGGDITHDVENPLAKPPEVTWASWVENEIITHGRIPGSGSPDLVPILNPAGRPYNPPLTRRRRHRMVTIVRNEATFPVAIVQAYEGCVNSDAFYGWLPNTAMLEDVSATQHYAQAMRYWTVRYEIRFRKPSWTRAVLRAGVVYWEFDALTQTFVEKIPADEDGVYHTDPVLLNELGMKLTPDEIATRRLVPWGQPNGLYDYWDVDYQKPFAALNL
jgi:hypothetical protein